jgi:hypothetical protein
MTGRRIAAMRLPSGQSGAASRRSHQTTAPSSWWHWRHGDDLAKEVPLMWGLGLITAGTAMLLPLATG